MMRKILFPFLILCALTASFMSCQSNKDELLNPVSNCDTTGVTYNTTVVGIIRANCTRCHSAAANQAPFNLETYEQVRLKAVSGELVGAIAHEPGYTPMPLTGAQLSECDIERVRKWVQDGAPNN